MKGATVKAHARRLRRICDGAATAPQANVSRLHGPAVVGDLSPFTLDRIAALFQAETLAAAIREWSGAVGDARVVPLREVRS